MTVERIKKEISSYKADLTAHQRGDKEYQCALVQLGRLHDLADKLGILNEVQRG